MGGSERGRNPEDERHVGHDGQHDLKTRCDGTGHAELHAVCKTASLPPDKEPGSCDGVGAVGQSAGLRRKGEREDGTGRTRVEAGGLAREWDAAWGGGAECRATGG